MNGSEITDWTSTCALVWVLGCRHGLDVDHLVTIDGLTRSLSHEHPGISRYCGVLFSLGHGGVVLLIALTVNWLAQGYRWPFWLDGVGTAISVTFLTLLGALNLRSVWQTQPQQPVLLRGLKGRWLGALSAPANPWLVALVGALFAVSFDTFGQAALFAGAGARFGGWEQALLLGLLFVAGMLMVDGINGIWVFRLLRRTDRMGIRVSRFMGWLVTLASFLVAALAVMHWALPAWGTP